MHLIQMFIPVRDNKNKAFPKGHYADIRMTLTKEFGGLTAYTHAPAEGLWKDDQKDTQHDDMVIFEVMAAELDKKWWKKYKKQLELTFAQDEIIIRAQKVKIL
jgi:2-hydroxychromene-2-carboxylate isomerase